MVNCIVVIRLNIQIPPTLTRDANYVLFRPVKWSGDEYQLDYFGGK